MIINLFHSSSRDEDGHPLIKAVVTASESEMSDLGDEFLDGFSKFLNEPDPRALICEMSDIEVRWLG